MRASLGRLLDAKADIPPESLICPHIPSGGRHDAAAAAEWLSYRIDPRLLDVVEQLIGPDIGLWGSQVFCKPALGGREVPWHSGLNESAAVLRGCESIGARSVRFPSPLARVSQ
jgi:hypothetical protein